MDVGMGMLFNELPKTKNEKRKAHREARQAHDKKMKKDHDWQHQIVENIEGEMPERTYGSPPEYQVSHDNTDNCKCETCEEINKANARKRNARDFLIQRMQMANERYENDSMQIRRQIAQNILLNGLRKGNASYALSSPISF